MYSNNYLSTNHNWAMCTYGNAMVLSMIRACALDCALHHAVKISMRDNGHWLSINKNTLNAQHQSHQINRKAALLPANIVILFAVAVTKVKCIYCCKFFTSWYHFMDNNNKSWSNTSKWSIIKNTSDITRDWTRDIMETITISGKEWRALPLDHCGLYIYEN